MATVTTEVPALQDRTTVGVVFQDGKGETDNPAALAFFERHPDRFTVEHDAEPDAADEDNEDGNDEAEQGEQGDGSDPYDVGRTELRKLAAKRGLSTSGNKAELQARLREADESEG